MLRMKSASFPVTFETFLFYFLLNFHAPIFPSLPCHIFLSHIYILLIYWIGTYGGTSSYDRGDRDRDRSRTTSPTTASSTYGGRSGGAVGGGSVGSGKDETPKKIGKINPKLAKQLELNLKKTVLQSEKS